MYFIEPRNCSKVFHLLMCTSDIQKDVCKFVLHYHILLFLNVKGLLFSKSGLLSKTRYLIFSQRLCRYGH